MNFDESSILPKENKTSLRIGIEKLRLRKIAELEKEIEHVKKGCFDNYFAELLKEQNDILNADENDICKKQATALSLYFPEFKKDYQKLIDNNVIQETENGFQWNFKTFKKTAFIHYFRDQVENENAEVALKVAINIFKPTQNYTELNDLYSKSKPEPNSYSKLLGLLKR